MHLSLLDWLREFDTSKTPPLLYKRGSTLVGTKLTSVFKDEYFFQDMLLYVPHRNIKMFHIAGLDAVPNVIKHFVCALHHRASVWLDKDVIKSKFELQGHRSWYVSNIILHVQSLKDLYHLWQKRVISFGEITTPSLPQFPLDAKQRLIMSLAKNMLCKRRQHYSCLSSTFDDFDADAEENEDFPHDLPSVYLPEGQDGFVDQDNGQTELDWRKYLLVVGKPGTGKSHSLIRVIEMCISQAENVLIATPTGFLATKFKYLFQDDIDSDTVHAAFHFPVSVKDQLSYNWNLSNYDLIVIDELSMIPLKIFHHILETVSELPICPIVLLAGDDQQLQPIEKVDGKIQTAETAMKSEQLPKITTKVLLTERHRSEDNDYAKFLQHIGHWRPSQNLLDKIQIGRTLFDNDPTDEQLLKALTENPNSTVITVSHNAANRINQVV